MRKVVIEAKDLTKQFGRSGKNTDQGIAAVDHVSFCMYEGEILGLLGESGCGKTTLARMLMHLILPTSGTISINGPEIQSMPERRFRKMRKDIQMVFQNPFDSLDPTKTITSILEEPLKVWYPRMNGPERAEKIRSVLEECGLPEESLQKRPEEFSGGQLQRISIARALLPEPHILIADEIVSALDVPVQNQILTLLQTMKEEHHLTVLFITHDLFVAERISDRIMVMKDGRIRAIGTSREILNHAEDPYIKALTNAVFSFEGACCPLNG